MLETKPRLGADLSRTNQYLSSRFHRFSASPPTVLLSGFRSALPHCHQGCFYQQTLRVQQGLYPINSDPVHSRWVSQGGTPDNFRCNYLIQHQNLVTNPFTQCQTRASRLLAHFSFWFVRLLQHTSEFYLSWPIFSFFFPWFCLFSDFLLVCSPCVFLSLRLLSCSFLAQPSLAPILLVR